MDDYYWINIWIKDYLSFFLVFFFKNKYLLILLMWFFFLVNIINNKSLEMFVKGLYFFFKFDDYIIKYFKNMLFLVFCVFINKFWLIFDLFIYYFDKRLNGKEN